MKLNKSVISIGLMLGCFYLGRQNAAATMYEYTADNGIWYTANDRQPSAGAWQIAYDDGKIKADEMYFAAHSQTAVGINKVKLHRLESKSYGAKDWVHVNPGWKLPVTGRYDCVESAGALKEAFLNLFR